MTWPVSHKALHGQLRVLPGGGLLRVRSWRRCFVVGLKRYRNNWRRLVSTARNRQRSIKWQQLQEKVNGGRITEKDHLRKMALHLWNEADKERRPRQRNPKSQSDRSTGTYDKPGRCPERPTDIRGKLITHLRRAGWTDGQIRAHYPWLFGPSCKSGDAKAEAW